MKCEQQLAQAPMPPGKKKVLLAALKLFADKGFHATTTAKIAQQAGVSEGTIYKYFTSKENLLTELLSPMLNTIKDNFLNQLNNYEQLPALINFFVNDRSQFVIANYNFFKLLLQELLLGESSVVQLFHAMLSGSAGILAKLASLQQRFSEINTQLTPIQIARIFIGPLIAYVFQEQMLPDSSMTSQQSDLQLVQQQILAGLTAPQP